MAVVVRGDSATREGGRGHDDQYHVQLTLAGESMWTTAYYSGRVAYAGAVVFRFPAEVLHKTEM